jgi:hypothetical protein
MMRTHLDTTMAEASARFSGNWTADVAAYDAVENHILHMSDALSAAIERKFCRLRGFTPGKMLLAGAIVGAAVGAGYLVAKK